MLSYLVKQSRWLLLSAVLASIAAGVCSVLLVAQINAALTVDGEAARAALAWNFGAVAVAAMATNMASSVLFERLSQRAQAELRRFTRYVDQGGPSRNSRKALADVFWALLNSAEFRLNH